jgi:hypothetical protein
MPNTTMKTGMPMTMTTRMGMTTTMTAKMPMMITMTTTTMPLATARMPAQ